MWYLFAGYAAATAILSLIHVVATKRERTASRIWGIILAYAILFFVGAQGLLGFYGHAFRPGETAEMIGWAAGSPFQFEVACTNLAFGILGIICLWMRANFRLATILGYSIFLLGAAVGHIHQLIAFDNKAPGNSGAILYADIIIPTVLLTLWVIQFVISRRRRERELIDKCTQQVEKGGEDGRRDKA